jgi:DNA-binding transcriptional regulator YiaG
VPEALTQLTLGYPTMTTKQSILDLMARHSLNERQCAELLGVPINTLHHWLAGTRSPGAATDRLIEVLTTLEVMVPDLFGSFVPDSRPPGKRGRPKAKPAV